NRAAHDLYRRSEDEVPPDRLSNRRAKLLQDERGGQDGDRSLILSAEAGRRCRLDWTHFAKPQTVITQAHRWKCHREASGVRAPRRQRAAGVGRDARLLCEPIFNESIAIGP